MVSRVVNIMAALGLTARAWTRGSGFNVIVVTNQNRANSVRLGGDYRDLRDVPPQNLFRTADPQNGLRGVVRQSILLLAMLFPGCRPEPVVPGSAIAAAARYETAMISSGDNRPDFKAGDPELKAILVSLHRGKGMQGVDNLQGAKRKRYERKLEFLKNKGLARENAAGFVPTCMVISGSDGEHLYEIANPLAEKLASLISTNLPEIRKYYLRTELSKTWSFEKLSFLVLSDVLLDNWQIASVEREFLGQERPLRHGKRYYFALLENRNHPREAFGLYGNGVFDRCMVYGNNRKSGLANSVPQNPAETVPVCEADEAIFKQMAAFFQPALLRLLRDNRACLEEAYHKTGYANEVSFEEFFIWWYHFFYTRATDILARQGHLQIPASGNFYYR